MNMILPTNPNVHFTRFREVLQNPVLAQRPATFVPLPPILFDYQGSCGMGIKLTNGVVNVYTLGNLKDSQTAVDGYLLPTGTPEITVCLNWPGYQPLRVFVPLNSCYTLSELVRRVSLALVRMIQTLSRHTSTAKHNSYESQWIVKEDVTAKKVVMLEHLYLVGLYNVDHNVWQADIAWEEAA